MKVLLAQIVPYYYFFTFPLSSDINFFCLSQFQMTSNELEKRYLAIQVKILLAKAVLSLSLSPLLVQTPYFPLFPQTRNPLFQSQSWASVPHKPTNSDLEVRNE
jgi:hypothetical protein